MIKFKVGDRVKVLKRHQGELPKVIGVVARVGNSVTVKFKGWGRGHGGHTTQGSREYWSYPSCKSHLYLEKVHETWKEKMGASD